jgi:hypothetical protein
MRRDSRELFMSCGRYPDCTYARPMRASDPAPRQEPAPEVRGEPAAFRPPPAPTRLTDLVCTDCDGDALRMCPRCRRPVCEDCRPDHAD